MKEIDKKLTILMTSCKAYQDVLQIHDKLFQKYWSNCPFEKVLVIDEDSGNKSIDYRVIEAGTEAQGSKNGIRTVKGLKEIKTPYVLLLQEDFLLCDYVDTEQIKHIINLMDKYNAGNIRLVQSPKPSGIFLKDNTLMEYRPGMAYRLSMQAGIWNTNYLLRIFSKYDNGAEFERRGSFYSAEIDMPVLAYQQVVYPFINAIQNGAWKPKAVAMLRDNQIEPDFALHPLMSKKTALKNTVKSMIISINPKMVVKIQNALSAGKKY